MSAKDEVLAHYGAGLSSVGLGDFDEFALIAEIKGKINPKGDAHDDFSQLVLRSRAQSALHQEPDEQELAREVLRMLGRNPDDEGMVNLLASWRAELYDARPHDISRQAWPKDPRGDGVVKVAALPTGLAGASLDRSGDVLPDGL